MALPRPVALTLAMLFGVQRPPDRTPASVGLRFEDVTFRALDGVELKGWFIPAPGAGGGVAPAVGFVHGWAWNRLGNRTGVVPVADRDVDFLPAAKGLHDAGIGVLLFDLRNHGESGKAPPATYGPREARDVIGAVAWLRGRRDVDPDRIGLLGCSAGANAILYALPDCAPVRAVLAVQPARLGVFNRNFSRDAFGPIGVPMAASTNLVYLAWGAPRPSRHDPAIPAAGAGDTVVRYVQGTGDQWGRMSDVEDFVAATPNAQPLVRFESEERYDGYRYVQNAVGEVVGFFVEQLAPGQAATVDERASSASGSGAVVGP